MFNEFLLIDFFSTFQKITVGGTVIFLNVEKNSKIIFFFYPPTLNIIRFIEK